MKKIPLTQGQVAFVDDEDFARFGHLKWHASWSKNAKSFYARNSGLRDKNGKQRGVMLHRLILGVTDPRMKADHRDHNTLNNRRANLRACTNSQNQMNRRGPRSGMASGHRGVYLHRSTGKWRAMICVSGKLKSLGLFFNKSNAAKAYAAANRKHFGEFGGGL